MKAIATLLTLTGMVASIYVMVNVIYMVDPELLTTYLVSVVCVIMGLIINLGLD